jgi:hypothetical protein
MLQMLADDVNSLQSDAAVQLPTRSIALHVQGNAAYSV